MRLKSYISIRSKLVFSFLVLSLAPLILLGLYNTLNLKDTSEATTKKVSSQLMETSKNTLSNITQANSDKVQLLVDLHQNDIKMLAKLPAIKSLLLARIDGEWVNSKPKVIVDNYFKSVQMSNPDMSIIRLMYKDGGALSRVINGGTSLIDPATGRVENKSDKLWFQIPMDSSKLNKDDLYVSALNMGRTNKQPEIRYSVPITINNKRVGVLDINYTAETITKSVASTTFGTSGYTFMLDKNYETAEGKKIYGGIYLSHPTMKICDEKQPGTIINIEKIRGSYGLLTFINSGKEWTAAYRKVNIPGREWYVVAALPTAEITRSADTLNSDIKSYSKKQVLNLWIFALITVVIVISIAIFISYQITTPIQLLTVITDRISMGETNININIRTNDEIGVLAMAIKRMLVSLRFLMSDDIDKSA
jgi:HAMP domain-containing protein